MHTPRPHVATQSAHVQHVPRRPSTSLNVSGREPKLGSPGSGQAQAGLAELRLYVEQAQGELRSLQARQADDASLILSLREHNERLRDLVSKEVGPLDLDLDLVLVP